MPFDPNQSIAERTRFTPAERAVLVEKTEAMKVSLEVFIGHVKDGTPQELVTSLIPCAQEWDGIQSLITDKLKRTIMEAVLNEG